MVNTEQDIRMLSELDKALDIVPEKSETHHSEDISDFSTDNMSFEDITAVIMDHTEDLFSLTGSQDRFSAEYLTSCRILLKAIRHLGSSFITKTALIARDFDVPKLQPLTARRLQEMVSFHIRKCDAAMKEILSSGQDFSFDHYDLLLELANSSQRLRATQNKASDVQNWIIKPYRLADSAMSFTNNNGYYCCDTGDYTPRSFRTKCAYGLRTEVLKEYEQIHENLSEALLCEPDVPMRPETEPIDTAYTAKNEDQSGLFALIDKHQPGMGKILCAANEKASEIGFTKSEKALLFNALQYELVREMIIEHLEDPKRCADDPDRTASYRKVQAVLDG